MCKALEDWRQEEREEGREEGFIEALQGIGISYEDIMKKLCEKFSLTEDKAEQKMKQFWKVER